MHRNNQISLGRIRVFPHQLSWLIDNPLRRCIITPTTLATRLRLSDSSCVLEVGPGSGYFSAALAARVPQGHLELFDVQPEMLAKAERKLQRAGFGNVGYTIGDAANSFPFPDDSFDLAVLVSVLGEVQDQDRCLRSLYRVLRPNGTLAIHEAIPDPDRISFVTLRDVVEAKGFQFCRKWGHAWNYTAIFTKSEANSAIVGDISEPVT